MQQTDELENTLKHLTLGERLVSVARRMAIEHVRQELRESANVADERGADGVHTVDAVEPDAPAIVIPPRPVLPPRGQLRQDLFQQPMLRSDAGGKEAA